MDSILQTMVDVQTEVNRAVFTLNQGDYKRVLLCKDCRWWMADKRDCRQPSALMSPNEDDYCSFGERRKDDTGI